LSARIRSTSCAVCGPTLAAQFTLNARQPKFLFGTVAVLNRLQHPIAVRITVVPHAGL
jgi:hypothetical protein